jgi:hypothetical protein
MRWLDTHSQGRTTAGAAMGRLNVLLIYEDLSTGLRARWAFEQTARQLEGEADFYVDLWKFDLLCEPALLQRAANDAAKADIVFLSAHGQGELPGTVNVWLKQWLERRGGEPCALAVLLDEGAGDNAAADQALQALQAMALAGGVQVFLNAGEALQTRWQSALDEVQRHPEAVTMMPAGMHREFEVHSYRDWGINE